MNQNQLLVLAAVLVAGLLAFFLVLKPFQGPPTPAPQPVPVITLETFAKGLNSPRGLTFGPDGALYVAEAGLGGSNSTADACEQVVPPVGPYLGGNTARISKIGTTGQRATLADGLPSDQASADIGSEPSGAADVAFIDGVLYALIQAGCSHGNLDMPTSVVRIEADGSASLVSDLGSFLTANPAVNPQPLDFEPDGSVYDMVSADGALYVVESNHGMLIRVEPDGQTTLIADISASQGHIVPTAIAQGPDGNLYVGTLTPLPYPDGKASVLRVTPQGTVSVFAKGFTMITGIAFDGRGRLYVLQAATGNTPEPPFIAPGTGMVVRWSISGTLETVASGLTFPTAIAFGPDGLLYISNVGFGKGPAAGLGEILRVQAD